MEYIVRGSVELIVEVTVKAENAEEAIEKAYDNIYISSYCGNGGNDKLVGVENTDEAIASIYPNGDIEYEEAELA